MGRKKESNILAVRHTPKHSAEARRELKVVGAGAAIGSAAGAVMGSSMGVAAFGGAMVATGPLALIGGLLGASAVGLWSLFLGGDKKRIRLFQKELEDLHTENRALRQKNSVLIQEVLDASSNMERISSDFAALEKKVKERDGIIKSLSDTQRQQEVQIKAKIWVGSTQTGAVVLFDPECQLNYGKHALFFLPNLPGFRVFDRSFMRARLTKVSDEQHVRYIDAYMQWLSEPNNRDIQKEGIARLVKRSGTNPSPPTTWNIKP